MEYLKEYKTYLNDNFWKWFGKSKMIDKVGNPLICYHGTNRDFTEFKNVGHVHDKGYYGYGYYFTFGNDKFSQKEAEYYGRNIMKVYLKIEKPFYFSDLLKYEGTPIRIFGLSSMIFLYNISNMFPELNDIVKLNKTKYSDDDVTSGTVESISIGVLSKLIKKYKKYLTIFEFTDNRGDLVKSGYVKSKIIEFDYTDKGGKKGSYVDYEQLGTWLATTPTKELEIGLIFDAIEKYDGISAEFHPEGYMTRYPEISESIKNRGYDGILQSEYGDEVVVFSPNQIKSAISNNGNFDINNNNINEKINIIDNKYFWKWFKNSKVVDKNNNPLIVYHGTTKKFNVFDKSKQVYGHHGKGFYFANKEYAEGYYGNDYIAVYLSIQNMFDIFKEYTIDEVKNIFKNDYNLVESIILEEINYNNYNIGGYLFYTIAGNERLKSAGYDGIKHDYVYVVFEPNQIKSIDNDGTFDIDDENIYS